jgi:CheY-like chemotaxis protein
MTADLTKVRQSLFNLLSNACKFTQGGLIELKAEKAEMEGTPVILFHVKDNGIGLSEKQINRLFQSFTQADSSTKRKYGGTGLGLTISLRYCEMMGGNIQVQSEPDKGSEFTILLPVSVDEDLVNGVLNEESPVQPQTRYGTILVIDDEAFIRDLMSRNLRKEGFHVETASSGQEGLAMAKRIRPDAITLDLIMPVMDGWSVLESLRNDPELNEIPVIILSISDDKNMGYALGASEFLTKPVEREHLIKIMNKYKNDKRAQSVLVIDDDRSTSEMMVTLLTKEGWQAKTSENGKEALEELERQMPDLILLDLMMPEMDGFDFIANLQQHPKWTAIPVIVVTAKDLTAEERRLLNGRVQNIVQKGTDSMEEVVKEITKLLKSQIF